jgi:hypothetical protein
MQMFVTSYSSISLVVLAVAVQGGHTGGVIIRVACFQKKRQFEILPNASKLL